VVTNQIDVAGISLTPGLFAAVRQEGPLEVCDENRTSKWRSENWPRLWRRETNWGSNLFHASQRTQRALTDVVPRKKRDQRVTTDFAEAHSASATPVAWQAALSNRGYERRNEGHSA
jgi:hypothetical protein